MVWAHVSAGGGAAEAWRRAGLQHVHCHAGRKRRAGGLGPRSLSLPPASAPGMSELVFSVSCDRSQKRECGDERKLVIWRSVSSETSETSTAVNEHVSPVRPIWELPAGNSHIPAILPVFLPCPCVRTPQALVCLHYRFRSPVALVWFMQNFFFSPRRSCLFLLVLYFAGTEYVEHYSLHQIGFNNWAIRRLAKGGNGSELVLLHSFLHNMGNVLEVFLHFIWPLLVFIKTILWLCV